jgi:hypothetical protein
MTTIHRTGPVDLQNFDVALTSTVPTSTIEIGDAVAYVSSKAVPASAFTWTTDLATTQTAFAVAFLGISESRSRAGVSDTRDLRIAVNMDGTYEADCTSASYTVGQFVGLAKDTGNNLLSAKVEGVASKARAIGVVVEAGTTVTKVKIRLLNTLSKK